MKIKINNDLREVADGVTLTDLLADIPHEGMATAVNGRFVALGARDATLLEEGDEVTVISAAYGG